MAWLRFDEIVARAEQVVPYDLGALALHNAGVRFAGASVITSILAKNI